MTKMLISGVAFAALLVGCAQQNQEAESDKTAATTGTDDVELILPADYRSYGTYMISDRLGQEDQVIALYANDVARDGARADGKLPNGSIIVGELYKAKTDADGEVIYSAVNRRVPGEMLAIVMMERQEGWDDKYVEELTVGDWEFEVFSPAGENLGRDTTACRECHHPLTDTEYTFSYEHLAAAN